jgi:hypothetical protein
VGGCSRSSRRVRWSCPVAHCPARGCADERNCPPSPFRGTGGRRQCGFPRCPQALRSSRSLAGNRTTNPRRPSATAPPPGGTGWALLGTVVPSPAGSSSEAAEGSSSYRNQLFLMTRSICLANITVLSAPLNVCYFGVTFNVPLALKLDFSLRFRL